MLRELAFVFLRLGATSFGGPLAHIALMRQEFVERREWLSEREFLDLNGAVNLIPGPNSTELAMHIGWKRAGFPGLLVAGTCFILPAMLMVLILSALYARYGALPATRAILWGVAPVVVVIVGQALLKFARTALLSWRARVMAGAALVAVAFGISEVGVTFAAAAIGLVAASLAGGKGQPRDQTPRKEDRLGIAMLVGVPATVLSASAWGVLWTFLKIGCLVYGSGYVLLAYLRSEFVERLGWVSDRELLDAIAIGQVTPGPVFTTATFLGFQIAGWSGAIAATIGIFGPSFVFVALLGTVLDRLKDSPRARVFLDCVNAASLSLMAFVSFQLARETLTPGGHIDLLAVVIGAGATLGLVFTRFNPAWFLAIGATLGATLGPR